MSSIRTSGLLGLPWRQIRLLVVAPHQGCCVIGSGGMLEKARANGAKTGILYVSRSQNGALIGEPAEEARLILGIAESAMHCLGRGERGLVVDEALIDDFVRFLRFFKPNVIISPHPRDDDPMHEKTRELVRWHYLASEQAERHLGAPSPEILLWLGCEIYTPVSGATVDVELTPQMMALKHRLISLFPVDRQFSDAAAALQTYRAASASTPGGHLEAHELLKNRIRY